MIHSIKIIITLAVVALIGSAILLETLNILDIYSFAEVWDYFIKTASLIGLFALGALIIVWIVSLFSKK